jgi:phage FluMu protein Com
MSKIKCCSCGKVIAENISIQKGFVEITCKCGTLNRIEAETPVKVSGESFTARISRNIEKK